MRDQRTGGSKIYDRGKGALLFTEGAGIGVVRVGFGRLC